MNVVSRADHGMTSVDMHALFSGPPAALEWRLQLVDNGGSTVPLPANDALVMVDLVTKVEVEFDQHQYFIGDDIRLTPITVESVGSVGKSLNFYMGKNTPERRAFIEENLITDVT